MRTGHRSESFYMHDNMIEILVEEKSFRIPSSLLTRNSAYFSELLEWRDDDQEVSSIDLSEEGVSASAFENLLHALDSHPSGGKKPSLPDEWKDALRLSDKWNFPQIRTTAIERLELLQVDPLEKIQLAAQHEIRHWFVDAYIALCQRPEALSPNEVRILLPEDVSAFSLVQKARIQYSATSRPSPTANEVFKFSQRFYEASVAGKLIETYGCALERRGTFTHGRLYISQKHVCFYSPQFTPTEQITLPVSAIQEPKKEWTALIFPNAIRVSTTEISHKFTSFATFGWRDTAFDVIYGLWVERKRVEMSSIHEANA